MKLLRAVEQPHGVRLEFAGGVSLDVSAEEYERRKDNGNGWWSFPPRALRVLLSAAEDFDEYVAMAAEAHGHICAGQILGLRMALYGLELLGIDDPAGKDRKRLVTFVEIDRCATDAITVVTGCRMGKRALKFRDFGKVAATFCDLAGTAPCAWWRANVQGSARGRCTRRSRPERSSRCAPTARCPTPSCSTTNGCGCASGPRTCPATRRRGWSARLAAKASTSAAKWCARAVTLCRACAGERYYEPL